MNFKGLKGKSYTLEYKSMQNAIKAKRKFYDTKNTARDALLVKISM